MTTALHAYPARVPKTETRHSHRTLLVFWLSASGISLAASFSLLAAAVYIH
jgi:hypothetical protein